MIEASFLAAFLGGVMALLSPCSALLLPAFFAYAFGAERKLVKRTLVFYLGLSATLVPLGMGIAAFSRLFYGYRSTLIWIAGLLLIALGIVQLTGKGFSMLPGGLRSAPELGGSMGSTFALGATYGLAGFCSGPILGAILTVAAASGGPFQGAALLAVYAFGMAFPLLIMALVWGRYQSKLRWLRGREINVGPLRVHSNRLISGLMFVTLGVLFITFEGSSGFSSIYESFGATSAALAVENWIQSVAAVISDGVVAAAIAGVAAVTLTLRFLRKRRSKGSAAVAPSGLVD